MNSLSIDGIVLGKATIRPSTPILAGQLDYNTLFEYWSQVLILWLCTPIYQINLHLNRYQLTHEFDYCTIIEGKLQIIRLSDYLRLNLTKWLDS